MTQKYIKMDTIVDKEEALKTLEEALSWAYDIDSELYKLIKYGVLDEQIEYSIPSWAVGERYYEQPCVVTRGIHEWESPQTDCREMGTEKVFVDSGEPVWKKGLQTEAQKLIKKVLKGDTLCATKLQRVLASEVEYIKQLKEKYSHGR